jgi:glycerophosphoryl diester phosphodiesterase
MNKALPKAIPSNVPSHYNQIKIFAHRGAPQAFPENTLAAFRQALEDGARGFECDLALTKDLEPVVVHIPFYSDDISSLVGVSAKLGATNWADLKKMNIRGQPVLHLHDLLAFVSGGIAECFLEPKRTSLKLMEKTIRAIEKYNVQDRVHIITFFSRRQVLAYSKQLNPRIRTSVILVTPFGDWNSIAQEAHADMVVPGWKKYNFIKMFCSWGMDIAEKVKKTQSLGTIVHSGEADDEANLRWLCEIGVQGIFTNNVPLAKIVTDAFYKSGSNNQVK